jgi:hypothetical protein
MAEATAVRIAGISTTSIRTITQSCRQKFQECAGQSLLRNDNWVETRSMEFNLWDSGIGACANELNCLDKRLERDEAAQKVVLSALNTLAAWIMRCKELAESAEPTARPPAQQLGSLSIHEKGIKVDPSDEITLDEAKTTVEELLKVLVDLEIAIRRAGMASRLRRADRTFEKQKSDYTVLSKHLEFILRVYEASRREEDTTKRQCTTSGDDTSTKSSQNYERVEQHTANPGTNETGIQSALDRLWENKMTLRPEQQILILANIKRAHRFEFHKRRKTQLQPEQMQEHPQVDLLQTQSARSHPSDPRITNEERYAQPLEPVTSQCATPAPSQAPTRTTNHASHYMPELPLDNAIEAKEAPGPAATVIALRANYPKPPKEQTSCPYCSIPFRSKIVDVSQWRYVDSMFIQSERADHAGNTPQRTYSLTRATCRIVVKIILSSIHSVPGNHMC